jgi:hypothetical protein
MSRFKQRRLYAVLSILSTAALLASAVAAVMPAARAQQRPQCAEGLNLTVTGKIDRVQKMSRGWLFETDIRHPAPCRVTAIILRGSAPPEGCVAGKSITASGATAISEGSFPGAQIATSSITCR